MAWNEVPQYNETMAELFQALKDLGGSGTINETDAMKIILAENGRA